MLYSLWSICSKKSSEYMSKWRSLYGLVRISLTHISHFFKSDIQFLLDLTKITFCIFYLSGLGSIVYDVCSPCLSQYTTLVPIGCHLSFSWNNIFLSVPFVLRYLPENCQYWLATHCKYTISYLKGPNKRPGMHVISFFQTKILHLGHSQLNHYSY